METPTHTRAEIPPIADDVAALKDLLLWMRENHFSPQGAVIVARVSIAGGVIDTHPRRQFEQAGQITITDADLIG